jgi:hypothetical protein
MTEYTIRRTGVTETMIRKVYSAMERIGRPVTHLALRRAMPDTHSTSIEKAMGELMDRG